MIALSPIATDVLVPGIPIAEKVVRTVIVYAFLIAVIRVAGKRTLGSFNSFDLVVLLLLSNTVQNAIIGNDNSLIGGLIGASVLVAINWVLVRTMYFHHKIDHLVETGPTVLIRHGKLMEENLRRQLITRAELHAAARRQGVERLGDVCIARLETGGALTFELNSPTEEERRIDEITTRLTRIEEMLQALVDREGGAPGATVAHT